MKNYHTHTTRCKHAEGTMEEYIEAAIEMGYTTLGFSDHTPWPSEGRWRMDASEIEDYCNEVNRMKEKYKDKIDIKLGLEAEYVPELMDWLKNLIKKHNIEYLIFGNHWVKKGQYEVFYSSMKGSKESLNTYCESAIEGLKTGLYSYFAHPDWFMTTNYWWTDQCEEISRKICMYCKEHDIPLEYNLAGMRGFYEYPHPKFWQIAKQCGCKAIIGVDAHSPRHILNDLELEVARENLKELGIEIVDEIDTSLLKNI